VVLTETKAEAGVQPGTVYWMVAVPLPVPVTTPVGDTVATVTGVALHVPPVTDSDNVVVAVAQTENVPVIATGGVLTATLAVVAVAVREVVPQALVAVSV